MIERDGLQVEFRVQSSDVRFAEQLMLRLDITNASRAPFRLDAWLLDAPSLVLKVRRKEPSGDLVAVPLGPPPMPPARDDSSGLVELEPRQTLHFIYQGEQIFSGKTLPKGDYSVRLVYDKRGSPHNEWRGQFESEWMSFRVGQSP
jgi:hypothetical protein